MEGRSLEKNLLESIETLLPPSFKDAIRQELEKEKDPHSALLDQKGTFGKIWEGLMPQDKKHFFDKAGMDQATRDKLSQDIGDLYRTAKKEPRHSFNHEAAQDDSTILRHPDQQDKSEVAVTGAIDPAEETEEEAKARTNRYRNILKELAEEDDRKKDHGKENQNADGKDVAPESSGDTASPLDQNFTVKNIGYYRIRDCGDYLAIRGKGPRGQGGVKQIEDRQLKVLLLDAILNKKMTSLLFIKNGRLDSQLASRVRTMLQTDAFLQKTLGDKANVRVHMILPKEPPVWCTGAMSKWAHNRRYEAQMRQIEHSDRLSLKEGHKKLGKSLVCEKGQSLQEIQREEASKTGEPFVPPGRVQRVLHSVFGQEATGSAPETPDLNKNPEPVNTHTHAPS
ncbi:MAG: hypothetical protein CO093_06750 [Alphaproteobacteria bacterium CG_4_9_14_3_um_filter_47_13]|nr:MAG: hypothetical protein CO093_06750 [Alphaproteobacteria bacterium CG_4_9_14_3_um_filter_47_13]